MSASRPRELPTPTLVSGNKEIRYGLRLVHKVAEEVCGGAEIGISFSVKLCFFQRCGGL